MEQKDRRTPPNYKILRYGAETKILNYCYCYETTETNENGSGEPFRIIFPKQQESEFRIGLLASVTGRVRWKEKYVQR